MPIWCQIPHLQGSQSHQQNIHVELNLNNLPCLHDQVNGLGHSGKINYEQLATYQGCCLLFKRSARVQELDSLLNDHELQCEVLPERVNQRCDGISEQNLSEL